MTAPIDAVLSRLEGHKLRSTGQGRWRACCPVCGERNPSTLFIGGTPEGVVLLKCFKSGCSVDAICASVGLEVTDLFPPRESHFGPLQRRRLLSAGQALDLLHDEAQLIALCGSNIAHGVELTDDDRERCLTAAGRIAFLRNEVAA